MQLSPFFRGALAVILLGIGKQGVYWFMSSPAASDASAARVVAVAIQAAAGILIGGWLIVSHLREVTQAARPSTT